MLQKVVYSYEYIGDWEKFIETSLTEKKGFYCHLNMEDITDADYTHGKRVWKDFKVKNVGENHDLYVQSDILLADIFEIFRDMYVEIYELDPSRFFTAPGLARQTTWKRPT